MQLPPLHDAASAMSVRAQRQFVLATRVELALLIVAAAGGLLTLQVGKADTPIGAVVGLTAFAVAGFLRIYVLTTRPERRWYEGRAAAESVKTLAWRYAVGGTPFPTTANGSPDELFSQRIREVLSDLSALEPAGLSSDQITADMRNTRSSGLDGRKQTYLTDRIADQQAWYTDRSDYNRRQALRWGLGVLSLQLLGLGAGVARVAQWVDLNVIGVAATAAAAAAAWLQSRQHESLTTAYSVAAQELSTVRSLVTQQTTEQQWASFVEDAEEAISREHTMWRASRGVRAKGG